MLSYKMVTPLKRPGLIDHATHVEIMNVSLRALLWLDRDCSDACCIFPVTMQRHVEQEASVSEANRSVVF